jgi:transposase
MPVKLGFKNFYLYSAVAPRTGEHFTLQISHVDTVCMKVYLRELSEAFIDESLLLVLDGACWHKAKELEIPSNIELYFLPAYSPELNPVETLWQHVKRYTIRNKVYKELSDLEDAVHCFYNQISTSEFKSICAANYLIN